MSGRFVVLEGGDAAGKSTQQRSLATALRARGVEVVETREPGGTPLGAALRALLLDGREPIAPVAEALLMAADRAQHVEEVVRPALARGAWVLSDRHVPSSLVYQGIVRGLGVEEVAHASRWATGGLEPDLVVVLDVPDAVVEARRAGEHADRLELEGAEFHAAVRAGYRSLAAARGWAVVAAEGGPEDVARAVWAEVTARLDVPPPA